MNENKNRKTIYHKLMIVFILAIVFHLTSCVTTVPIKSVRSPTIDTSGIQRLAIRPFQNNSGIRGTLITQLARYLTDETTERIMSAGKFTIVSSSDPNADGIFIGEIKNIEVDHSQDRNRTRDKDGDIHIEVTYTRKVSLMFSYSVISSRIDMPIGTINKQGSASDSSTNRYELADVLTLAREIVDEELRQFRQDIVPTIVSTERKLMKETSKDKVLKQLMKDAESLVKNGSYEAAIRLYNEISRDYGSAAAEANASILRQAIASDISANAELAQLYNSRGGLTEQAIANAVNALNTKLPSGTNIVIMKTISAENDMLDYVVNQMTTEIIRGNTLKVVDRSNQTLINAEQQFQYSGYVSDDSMISIGDQLGVQYIVLCWISGEKSLRRLNLRVLNVETAQIIAQNDFEI